MDIFPRFCGHRDSDVRIDSPYIKAMNLDESADTDAIPPSWPGLVFLVVIAALLIASTYF